MQIYRNKRKFLSKKKVQLPTGLVCNNMATLLFWDTNRRHVKTLYIRHLLVSHNTPCMPPKCCIGISFHFSWDACNTSKGQAIFFVGGRGEGKQYVLWRMQMYSVNKVLR